MNEPSERILFKRSSLIDLSTPPTGERTVSHAPFPSLTDGALGSLAKLDGAVYASISADTCE
eukprot:6188057-Pleurochrysis_carterae.AAC.1